jgi:ankyrin repeat protein
MQSGANQAMAGVVTSSGTAQQQLTFNHLIQASQSGDLQIVTDYFSQSIDPDDAFQNDSTGNTALHWCIKNKHHQIFDFLLKVVTVTCSSKLKAELKKRWGELLILAGNNE